jgi:hypothetical protein
MKVQGADILSDVTEKTSRNLKATAAIVIAVKLFNVPVQDLRVLNVDLPPNLFDVISCILIAYMMIILVLYWRVDYLLWRDGPILEAKAVLERYLKGLVHFMERFEQHAKEQGVPDGGKYIGDHFAGIKVNALEYRRSIAKTTWWVRFVIFVLHLTIPLALGMFAVWLVGEGAWEALSNLQVLPSCGSACETPTIY